MEFQNRLGREVIIPDKNEIRAAMKARRKARTPEERKAASEIVCYLRITQKMKGGRKLSWSYRLPLK